MDDVRNIAIGQSCRPLKLALTKSTHDIVKEKIEDTESLLTIMQ